MEKYAYILCSVTVDKSKEEGKSEEDNQSTNDSTIARSEASSDKEESNEAKFMKSIPRGPNSPSDKRARAQHKYMVFMREKIGQVG